MPAGGMMAKPKTRGTTPPWFDLARYQKAGEMDAADWYLNLSLRAAIVCGECSLGQPRSDPFDGQLPSHVRRAVRSAARPPPFGAGFHFGRQHPTA